MSHLALQGASRIGFLIGGAFALTHAYQMTRPLYSMTTSLSDRVFFAGNQIFSSYPPSENFAKEFREGADHWHFNGIISLFNVVLFPYLGEKLGALLGARMIVAHPYAGPALQFLMELVGSISLPLISRPMILGGYIGLGVGIAWSFALNQPFHVTRTEEGHGYINDGGKSLPFEFSRSPFVFLLKVGKFAEEHTAGDPLKTAILIIFSAVVGVAFGRAWEKSTMIIASLSSSILKFALR